MSATVEKLPNVVAEARHQLTSMEGQFKAALPAHIPAERFARVVMTAVQNNPDLLKADRRSLWNSAMKAAQDGLLPDGREGALVCYGNQVQWMPMIAGIRKKARNSGEIETWDAHVVHTNDLFDYELGDNPFIRHKPTLDEPGAVIAAYSICTLKGGEKTREVMSIAAIEKVRKRSKAANKGPWVTDYEEMCRKTVARRHSKVIPMSTDLDDLIRRDDELYDLSGAKEEAKALNGGKPQSLAGRLDMLAGAPERTIDGTVEPDQGGRGDEDAAAESSDLADAGDAAAAEDATAEHDAPDTLDQARIAATHGRRHFDGWYNTIDDAAKDSIKDQMPELMKMAKASDAMRKE